MALDASSTPTNKVLNFTLPRGDQGSTGAGSTIAIGNVTTGTVGGTPSVTNSGTSQAAVLDFVLPLGGSDDSKLNIESDRNYSDDELAFVFKYYPSSTEPAEESYVYLDGMSNVKSHHDLVLKFRDKLENKLSNYSSGYTRQSFTYDNFEFYLEFSLGYVGTKILDLIDFTSGEPNAPTTALSKMRDEFTVTSGSKLFHTTGNNSYIQFTLEPKVRGLEDVYKIGSPGNLGLGGRDDPLAPLHVSTPGLRDYGGYTNAPIDMKKDILRIGTRVVNTPGYNNNEYGLQFGVSGSGNSSIQTYVYNHSQESVGASYNLLLQPNGGNIGIGTTSPYARLHVTGTSGSFTTTGASPARASYFINSSGLYQNTTGTFYGATIYGEDDIIAGGYVASFLGSISASDERIKKDIVDVDDGSALDTLRLLKPKRYKYRDEVARGSDLVWGFIAQEVRDTLPHATQLRRESVPNIYETADVSGSNVITFTDFTTSELQSNMVLKVYDKDDKEHLVNVSEVLDEHSLSVVEDLSGWTGEIEGSQGDKIFVYGQQVDDFVFLKKESIWTVATAALQEVDRQLQAEKTKVADLLARVEALESGA